MTEKCRLDESSLRYPGWRVVLACFLAELFIFGFGLYGQAVYVNELQRLHGWSTTLIATASTLSLLLGNLLVVFASDVLGWMGPRRMLLSGIAALAAAMVLLALTTAPWQLYASQFLMAFGWTGMGTVTAATIVNAWFNHRHGLAISLTFTGATCGGIVIAPVLLFLVGAIGFGPALLTATAVMATILVPTVLALVRLPESTQAAAPRAAQGRAGDAAAPPSRWMLLCSRGFWTASAPFAIALVAQVGFIVHQIAILEPNLGRSLAGAAVAVTTAMAAIGRLCLGAVADRLDPRATMAGSVASQAAALFAIAQSSNASVLFAACAVFGFSMGNLITLLPLIIRREFPQGAFGVVLGLSTAIGGVVSACGPSLLGLVRGASQSYAAPLLLCIALQLAGGALVLIRPPVANAAG